MAIAYFVPDQETLKRKALEQEQHILHMRAMQWKLLVSMILHALHQYVEEMRQLTVGRSATSCGVAARKYRKQRKPSN